MSRLLNAEPWNVVVRSRVHVLLTGPSIVTRALVQELRSHFTTPPIDVNCHEPLALSRMEMAGVVVLHDVDILKPADQWQALGWLDGIAGRTQVISTSTRRLTPLILTGDFLEVLYYRLNTVHVELMEMTVSRQPTHMAETTVRESLSPVANQP